jgi:transcriptional regulator with XRE-family HTH domain
MSAAGQTAIGTRVKGARERLGWNREELAFRAGVSWSAIAQIESHRRTNLRPGTLSSLAGTLGVTIDYLVSGGPTGTLLDHQALVYASDEEFVAAAGPYLRAGIERSDALLAVTTPKNIRLLRRHLGADAGAVEFADFASRFDAPASAIAGFRGFAGVAIEAGASWVRILAEPIWRGRTAPEVRLWTRLESLLNIAFASWPMTLLCPYDERVAPAKVIRQVTATHPRALTSEGPRAASGYLDPAGFILESGN